MYEHTVFGRDENLGLTDKVVRFTDQPLFFLTQGETLSVTSTSVNDTFEGTGARIVCLKGLDANFRLQSECLFMQGLTPVLSNLKYRRINNVAVVHCGALETNDGTISVKEVTGGREMIVIAPNYSISYSSLYTLPINNIAKLNRVFANVPKGTDATLKLVYRTQGSKYIVGMLDIFESDSLVGINGGTPPIVGGTDIYVVCKTSSANKLIGCFYVLNIYKDE